MGKSTASEVIQTIEKKFDVTLHNMAKKYCVDYVAVRQGEILSFVEIRQCADLFSAYIPLDVTKNATILQMLTGKPVVMFMQWPDETMWIDLTQQFPYIVGGQKQDDTFMEVEPCAVIPKTMFRSMEEIEV
tara:strand:+ start:1224 stop:1616 length:393 start_codon:yes stop_codon:yes gene_type:complete